MPFNAYNGDLYVIKTYVKSRTQTTSTNTLTTWAYTPVNCLESILCNFAF